MKSFIIIILGILTTKVFDRECKMDSFLLQTWWVGLLKKDIIDQNMYKNEDASVKQGVISRQGRDSQSWIICKRSPWIFLPNSNQVCIWAKWIVRASIVAQDFFSKGKFWVKCKFLFWSVNQVSTIYIFICIVNFDDKPGNLGHCQCQVIFFS